MSIGGDGYGELDRPGDSNPGYGRGESRQTTRTRLPGSDGGGRPPTRPGRSLITVVGVVVLLIAAIAFANKNGESDDSGSTAENGKDGGGAQPTAPSGDKPVEDSEGGIASGFPQSENGAQSAAANYAVALASDKILKPGERDAVIQQIFVRGEVEDMQAKMAQAYSPKTLKNMGLDEEGNVEGDGKYISRTAPVGTTVEEYSDNSAKLKVWCTGVFGLTGEDSKNPVTDDWFTMHLNLRWSGGDWKVQSFTQKKGPAPVNGDNKASSADQIAKAVEQFGGFTYAR